IFALVDVGKSNKQQATGVSSHGKWKLLNGTEIKARAVATDQEFGSGLKKIAPLRMLINMTLWSSAGEDVDVAVVMDVPE
ncbi:hypothetical protein AWZ03_014894, partial [Drosophila navojoa]